MVFRDSLKAQTELDKLQVIEPDEDAIAYIKTLVAEGDKAHVEMHLTALEGDYPIDDASDWTKTTNAVRAAL